MQIGNYDEDFNFNPILFSKGEKVEGRYRYNPGDLGPYGGEWIPAEFYTINPVIPSPSVPEPSTSLLCIIGFGVLMLKRKPCHG